MEDLPKIELKARKHWHPDRIEHSNDQKIVEEYTRTFQKIKGSIDTVEHYLTRKEVEAEQTVSEKIRLDAAVRHVRKMVPRLQQETQEAWNVIRLDKSKYSYHECWIGIERNYIHCYNQYAVTYIHYLITSKPKNLSQQRICDLVCMHSMFNSIKNGDYLDKAGIDKYLREKGEDGEGDGDRDYEYLID